MARKYDLISELYDRTCASVSENPLNWGATATLLTTILPITVPICRVCRKVQSRNLFYRTQQETSTRSL